ncbi:MAG TPA: glycosyltransferase [Candidatus Pacearchaeota archaeon]|nr:glycosyltransferase [Candidatus Pacearchaeota archaeon]
MKILQVNKFYYPWIGGVESVVQQIAEGLNKKNDYQVDVLVCQPQGKKSVENINGVNIFRASSCGVLLGMPISFDFFKIYKNIFKNYDAVFLHYPFPLSFLAYFLFSPRKKLYVWYHSDIVRQKFFEFFLKPIHLFVLKRAQKIFVSNPNLIFSSNYLKKFKEKCIVIPFGIEIEKFKLTEEIKNEAFAIKSKFGSPLVLAVGRLVYYKGFKYLIEAAQNVDAKFLIIGNGPLERELKNLINKLGLENKVFIISSVKNLIPYYYACDVFVLPSIFKSETFGIVLLEAMACGKPIISTELGTGTSWININNQTGFVVDPQNSKELAEKIDLILKDANLRKKFEANALRRAKDFSIESFINNLEKEILI